MVSNGNLMKTIVSTSTGNAKTKSKRNQNHTRLKLTCCDVVRARNRKRDVLVAGARTV